jgi:DNA-binding NtrC family response regulator
MKKPNVLIIEENENLKKRIVEELQKGFPEFEYLSVNNSTDLTTVLKQRSWDIILLNNILNQIDIFKAIEESNKYALGTPLIVSSESDSYEVAVETIRSGAYDFVPFNKLQKLNSVLEKALKNSVKSYKKKNLNENGTKIVTGRIIWDLSEQSEEMPKLKNETHQKKTILRLLLISLRMN